VAYGNFIASVPFPQIAALRADPNVLLRPSRMENVSHLLAYWVQAQPLGRLLGEALDGGERLADGLEHPLRPPVMHRPLEVRRLLHVLREALHQATAANRVREIHWFGRDIDKLLAVFEHAAGHGEAVVSVLEPPFDEERGAKVKIPFDATAPGG